MKFPTMLVVGLAGGLATAGCAKTSDIGAAKAEGLGLVQNYTPEFEDMKRRVDALGQRGNKIGVRGADAATASRLFSTTLAKVEELRNEAAQAPAAITAAATQGKRQDLLRMVDVLRARFIDGHTEVFSNLEAVDTWISLAEVRPAMTPPTPVPPAASQPTPVPEPSADTHPPGVTPRD